MAKLNVKQNCFAEEYAVDFNGTQAAIRAGYSPKTAKVQASRLMTNDNVQEAVQEAIRKRQRRTEINAERVLTELASVGFAEAEDFPTAALKVGNKLRALELIGKHLGMFDAKTAGQQAQESNLLDKLTEIASLDDAEGFDDIPELE